METLKRSLEVSKLIREIVFQIKHNMIKEFEKAGLPGITPMQGMMIGMLGKHGKMKVSEISRKMGLNNSTVSGIIDRLERQGIVERLRSEEDKRVVFIMLSTKMDASNIQMHSKIESIVERIIEERGTQEDYEKIIEGLSVLKRLLTETDGR
jgi:DNA-binding MarR family transcriptional regulator